jgi:hypothetical protein
VVNALLATVSEVPTHAVDAKLVGPRTDMLLNFLALIVDLRVS